jgi:hypothetical protein
MRHLNLDTVSLPGMRFYRTTPPKDGAAEIQTF